MSHTRGGTRRSSAHLGHNEPVWRQLMAVAQQLQRGALAAAAAALHGNDHRIDRRNLQSTVEVAL